MRGKLNPALSYFSSIEFMNVNSPFTRYFAKEIADIYDSTVAFVPTKYFSHILYDILVQWLSA